MRTGIANGLIAKTVGLVPDQGMDIVRFAEAFGAKGNAQAVPLEDSTVFKSIVSIPEAVVLFSGATFGAPGSVHEMLCCT